MLTSLRAPSPTSTDTHTPITPLLQPYRLHFYTLDTSSPLPPPGVFKVETLSPETLLQHVPPDIVVAAQRPPPQRCLPSSSLPCPTGEEMRGKGKEPREGVWVGKEGLSPSEALLRDCRTGFKGRKWEYLPISSCVCAGGGQLRALIAAGRQAGRALVAREEPQAESQVSKEGSPRHLSVVPRQQGMSPLWTTSYCVILRGLKSCTAFLSSGQSETWASWIWAPALALTHCAHLGDTVPCCFFDY